MKIFDFIFRRKRQRVKEANASMMAEKRLMAAKNDLYNEIDKVARSLGEQGEYASKMELNRILDIVCREASSLDERRIEIIKGHLAYIKAHSYPQYRELVMRRLTRIQNVVNGLYVSRAVDNEIDKIDDRIIEIAIEIKGIDRDVSEVIKQQERALGADKGKWEALNAEKKRLSARRLVLERNYKALLDQKQSLGVVADMETAREISDFIDAQSATINVAQVKLDAIINRESAEHASETQATLESILTDNYCQTSDDYEYERALEARVAPKMEAKKSRALSEQV